MTVKATGEVCVHTHTHVHTASTLALGGTEEAFRPRREWQISAEQGLPCLDQGSPANSGPLSLFPPGLPSVCKCAVKK